eukprot:TRINITY_DN8173_c0_g1_i5.p2 TRINITY_DN8173_c0_g1~~TRINITY_DN8173_c0_g1_i5.p2  ORF type:complete len:126 (+),score=26.82 TRINITY_DN8173_c0_g1_i5:178-555(+)
MHARRLATKQLSFLQWNVVEMACKLLAPFMIVQEILEGQKYVTCSYVAFFIYSLRLELETSITYFNSELEKAMDDDSKIRECAVAVTLIGDLEKIPASMSEMCCVGGQNAQAERIAPFPFPGMFA